MGHTSNEHIGGGLAYDTTPPDRKVGGIRRSAVPILLCGVMGIILLLWGNKLFPACDGKTAQATTGTNEASRTSEERVGAYRRELEARIEALCRQVKGAGDVTVAVSLDGGFKAVYAQEEKGGVGGTYRVFVTVGSGTSKSAVFISEEPPTITGIGIVCTGGDNMQVRSEITSLLSAAFSVGANKIYVTGR